MAEITIYQIVIKLLIADGLLNSSEGAAILKKLEKEDVR